MDVFLANWPGIVIAAVSVLAFIGAWMFTLHAGLGKSGPGITAEEESDGEN